MKQQRGFTLLEIMLVMLLLGLMASYVVVNFVTESRTSRLEKETERLQQLVQVVAETAILKQQDYGLMLNHKGYQFLWHDGVRWHEVTEPKSLQFHPWPEGMTAQLELEGLSWADDSILGQDEFRQLQQELLEQQAEIVDDKKGKDPAKKPTQPLLPNVYILSSGDLSPFQLVLADETERPFWYQELKGEYSIPLIKSELDNSRP
jgi:general secretion pathway protein H